MCEYWCMHYFWHDREYTTYFNVSANVYQYGIWDKRQVKNAHSAGWGEGGGGKNGSMLWPVMLNPCPSE